VVKSVAMTYLSLSPPYMGIGWLLAEKGRCLASVAGNRAFSVTHHVVVRDLSTDSDWRNIEAWLGPTLRVTTNAVRSTVRGTILEPGAVGWYRISAGAVIAEIPDPDIWIHCSIAPCGSPVWCWRTAGSFPDGVCIPNIYVSSKGATGRATSPG
jgi:hypothetical protein